MIAPTKAATVELQSGRRNPARYLAGWLTLSIATALSIVAIWPTDLAFSSIFDGFAFLRQWLPPSDAHVSLAFRSSFTTIAIAFLGASIGLVLGLPVALVGSSRAGACSPAVMLVLRAAVVVVRSTPEIVVALCLLVVFGPGPFAAMLAIAFHNSGVFAKLLTERIDEAPAGTFEALISLGAPRATAMVFGMLPEIWPSVVAQYFYRLEVGVRASIALGLIGAGGIGQQLINHFKTFQYREVSTDVIVIMIVIGVVDFISVRMQRAYT